MKTIGFIGLGHMGNPMVRNLLKAGFTLYVYDVAQTAVAALTKEGAHAASVAEIAKTCDVVITSLQTSDQVSKTCLNKDGIFSHAKPHLIYIDCSSIDISMTRQLHEAAQKHQIGMLDAPVSGVVLGAEAATLTFMVGGVETHFEETKSLLAVMGKKIIHAGGPGHGQAAKICNNLLLAISMIGTSEAFTLAQKLGLDSKKFFEISSNSSGQCWSMTSYCPVPGILENAPASHNYNPGFMASMMLKDLRLAQHAAETVDAITPLGSVATELYELYVNEGFGETDFSGIINLIGSRLE